MTLRRSLRPMAAVCLLFLASYPVRATDSAKWDPARTTAPDDVAELKALQASVKDVVEKATPATVAIIQGFGMGSGVIVSDDGLILTAAHVIDNDSPRPVRGGRGDTAPERPVNNKVRILFADGKTEVNGIILGRNPLGNTPLSGGTDAGMVRITSPVPKGATWPGASEGKWPSVELGKSKDLKKGQWVVAIGHPGGPKQDRRPPVRLGQMTEVTTRRSVIFSDCTLVGGDSGGPLFDLNGQLVGIHSRIGNDIANNMHVPTHAFEKDWKRLVRGDIIGVDSKAVIGIVLNREGKSEPKVDDIPADSPADQAGLKKGDVFLSFNGEKVKTSEDIDDIMSGLRPGQTVECQLQRGDDVYELHITLGKRTSTKKN